jgi:hypothetical protein
LVKKKEAPKPLFAVKHDFYASLDNFIQQSIMLHQAVRTVVDHADSSKPLPQGVIDMVKQRLDDWEKATLTDG